MKIVASASECLKLCLNFTFQITWMVLWGTGLGGHEPNLIKKPHTAFHLSHHPQSKSPGLPSSCSLIPMPLCTSPNLTQSPTLSTRPFLIRFCQQQILQYSQLLLWMFPSLPCFTRNVEPLKTLSCSLPHSSKIITVTSWIFSLCDIETDHRQLVSLAEVQ